MDSVQSISVWDSPVPQACHLQPSEDEAEHQTYMLHVVFVPQERFASERLQPVLPHSFAKHCHLPFAGRNLPYAWDCAVLPWPKV